MFCDLFLAKALSIFQQFLHLSIFAIWLGKWEVDVYCVMSEHILHQTLFHAWGCIDGEVWEGIMIKKVQQWSKLCVDIKQNVLQHYYLLDTLIMRGFYLFLLIEFFCLIQLCSDNFEVLAGLSSWLSCSHSLKKWDGCRLSLYLPCMRFSTSCIDNNRSKLLTLIKMIFFFKQ